MKTAIGLLVALALGCSPKKPKPAATTAASAAPPPAGAERCGELDCLAFDTPAAAFGYVLDTKPRVLAVGEAHARKGSEGVDSSSKRFREQLLPLVEHNATDLVVELLLPATNCAPAEKKVVEKVEKPVTSAQRSTNKSEFVALGERAKALGIQPWALTPSCEQFKVVADAGDDGVDAMLSLIAQLTRERIATLLAKRGPEALVVGYGGALHNDPDPDDGHRKWSFGPQLLEATGGRYVALDLFVAELIQDNEAWRRLVWYRHYDPKRNPGKTTLYRLGPASFALIFPAP